MPGEDEMGWEIEGRFYPHSGSGSLRHGDFALIRDVTGLDLEAFDSGAEPLVIETGWIAVAYWHGNPGLTRGQVVKYVNALPLDAVSQVGWDAPEDDALPPAEGLGATSGRPSSTSGAQPEETDSTTAEAA